LRQFLMSTSEGETSEVTQEPPPPVGIPSEVTQQELQAEPYIELESQPGGGGPPPSSTTTTTIVPQLPTDSIVDVPQHTTEREKVERVDYLNQGLDHFKKFTKPLKIHIVAGCSICMACLLVFHWTAKDRSGNYKPSNVFWWWIYPFCIFGISFSGHYFFSHRKWWKGTLGISVGLNSTLFLTWAFLLPWYNIAPWFIFPLFGTVIILVIAFYLLYRKDQFFRLLLNEYWLLNLLFFFIWLFYGQGFPWFIFPLCLMAIPLVYYRLRYTHQEVRAWIIAAAILALIDIALFFTWQFTGEAFPWFIIIWGASLAGIWILWWKKIKMPGASAGAYTPTYTGHEESEDIAPTLYSDPVDPPTKVPESDDSHST